MSKGYAVKAGLLRHRIEIQSFTESRSDLGGVERSWVTDATRWASIVPMSDGELVEGEKVVTRGSHEIRMRFYSDLHETHRFSHEGRIFNIVSILDIDLRNKVQTIRVIEDKDA